MIDQPTRFFASLALLFLLFLIGIPLVDAAAVEETIPVDQAAFIDLTSQLGYNEGDTVKVSLSLSPGTGDVYIMSAKEKNKYRSGNSFTSAHAEEKVVSAKFTWEVPDNQTYFLIVDNSDNANPNDAVPSGPLKVTGSIGSPYSIFKIALLAGGIVAIIVVIVIIRKIASGSLRKPAIDASQARSVNLGFTPGERGASRPRGADPVEQSLFGEGSYFATHSGFAEEEVEPEEYLVEDAVEAVPVAVPPPLPEESVQPSGRGRAATPAGTSAAISAEAEVKVTIACPGCAHKFKVPRKPGKQQVTCPACQLSGEMEVN